MLVYRSYLKKKKKEHIWLTLKIYALDFILMITELLEKLQLFFSTVFCDRVYSNLQHPGFFNGFKVIIRDYVYMETIRSL